MGLFRYLVQGFGWEVGRQAAREAIEATDRPTEPTPASPPPSPRQLALLQRTREREAARRRAEIDADLARLKRQVKPRT